jgi:hypothetical protein
MEILMTTQFKRAIRDQVGLLIGLAGGTGSGKTFSAFRLAAGICADKPFAVIDTEAGRAKHYADAFRFDHADLSPPFTPDAYAEAILAADAARYGVIIVDSMSHEWASEGGCLEMQEAELERMAGDDYRKREACRMSAWIRPKMAHKKMVQRLLQVRAHLILCFRAEEKIEMVHDDKGKLQVVPKVTPTGLNGWVPVCEKNLPYELTASFLLTADHPGIPQPIKLQDQHRPMFPAGAPIDEASGKLVAAWAAGGKAAAGPVTPQTPAGQAPQPSALPLADIEHHVDAMNDCESLDALKGAFEASKRAAGKDRSALDRFTAVKDTNKRRIEAAVETI